MPDATKNTTGILSVRGLDASVIQRAKNLAHYDGITLRDLVAFALQFEVERRESNIQKHGPNKNATS